MFALAQAFVWTLHQIHDEWTSALCIAKSHGQTDQTFAEFCQDVDDCCAGSPDLPGSIRPRLVPTPRLFGNFWTF